MCGIVGMIVPGGLQQVHLNYFTEMLQRCQARGTHATGAFNDSMQFVKAAIRSVDFVKTDAYKAFLAGCIGKTWIVGHCRLWSRGPPEFNENNHPVMLPGQEKKAMVIHNGFFDSPAFDKDKTKSDTHIPLWMTENDDVNDKDKMLEALKKIYAFSSGSFVFVMGTPDVLGFCRSHSKPLVFYTKGKNVAFASTEEILGTKPTQEMSVSQAMVFSKATKKWSKLDLAPATTSSTSLVEYQPPSSVEIGTDGRVVINPPPAVMFKQQQKQHYPSGKVVEVHSMTELRDRLDQLTELDEFTCFCCGNTLYWECVREIRDGRLFYICPEETCKNHVSEGWRSLKSLKIKYIGIGDNKKKDKAFIKDDFERQKKFKESKKDPRSWFEDRGNPCPGNFVPLDGFTNYGYCLTKEVYVNKDEDCEKCENGGKVNNEQHNESHA